MSGPERLLQEDEDEENEGFTEGDQQRIQNTFTMDIEETKKTLQQSESQS